MLLHIFNILNLSDSELVVPMNHQFVVFLFIPQECSGTAATGIHSIKRWKTYREVSIPVGVSVQTEWEDEQKKFIIKNIESNFKI